MVREALRKSRKAQGFNVEGFAKELGISKSYYYKIESGSRNPTIELAKKIADKLGKTVDELFFTDNLDESSNDQSAKSA